ncbi:DUF4838 domain-containing protein [bacterium]|nr:DUF4838 domain-containing protein [bacterium]
MEKVILDFWKAGKKGVNFYWKNCFFFLFGIGLLFILELPVESMEINSQTDYTIVIGREVSPIAKFAAEELQHYLKKIVSRTFPIKKDTYSFSSSDKLILVGKSKYTKSLEEEVDKLYPEGFIIKTKGNNLFLLGEDLAKEVDFSHPIPFSVGASHKGTLFAVYEFLEKYCGVRWFWPGESGEIIPKKKNICLGEIHIKEKPDFISRNFWWCGVRLSPKLAKAWALWQMRALRQGYGFELGFRGGWGHSWGCYLEGNKYYKEHPEYYALIGGSRKPLVGKNPMDLRNQICTSNPEVVKLFVEKIRKMYEPTSKAVVSISPNDGGGFCECANCKALDHPELYGPGDNLWREDRPVLSDRIMTFANAIAKEVKKTHPNLFLGILAYTYNFTPPKSVEKLEDNIIIAISQISQSYVVDEEYKNKIRKAIEGWSKIAKQFRISEHYGDREISSQLMTKVIAEDIPYLKQKGCVGLWTQIVPHVIPNHLNYYVAARLMWNTNLKLKDLLEDYYTKAYGKATSTMKQYFTFMEERFLKRKAKGWGEGVIPQWWSQEAIEKGYQYLNKALNIAQDEKVKQRIKIILISHQFTDKGAKFFRACQELSDIGVDLYIHGYRPKQRRKADLLEKKEIAERAYQRYNEYRTFLKKLENIPGFSPNLIYLWDKQRKWGETIRNYYHLYAAEKSGKIVFEENFEYPLLGRILWLGKNEKFEENWVREEKLFTGVTPKLDFTLFFKGISQIDELKIINEEGVVVFKEGFESVLRDGWRINSNNYRFIDEKPFAGRFCLQGENMNITRWIYKLSPGKKYHVSFYRRGEPISIRMRFATNKGFLPTWRCSPDTGVEIGGDNPFEGKGCAYVKTEEKAKILSKWIYHLSSGKKYYIKFHYRVKKTTRSPELRIRFIKDRDFLPPSETIWLRQKRSIEEGKWERLDKFFNLPENVEPKLYLTIIFPPQGEYWIDHLTLEEF